MAAGECTAARSAVGTAPRTREADRPRTVHGRPNLGYGYIHTAIDDHSRLAYSEILPDEQGRTAAGFWGRAHAWFTSCGITVREVLTDNGSCYRSQPFACALAASAVTHRRTRAYRPQTNGKVCEESAVVLHRDRSDPGQGMTTVSCVRFVGRLRCSTQARTGQTDLT